MNAEAPRETHFIASEIHRAMASANMSVAQLAEIIGESQSFVGRLLKGENHIGRHMHVLVLKAIANATGYPIIMKILPDKPAKRRRSVKPVGE